MTETQRKWLTEYLGECWHIPNGEISTDMMSRKCSVCGKWLHFADIELGTNRTFTTAKDKQDLLEAVIKKEQSIYHVFSSWSLDTGMDDFVVWLIKLSPEETAELICKWKGVE
jgi:hypothetical protein